MSPGQNRQTNPWLAAFLSALIPGAGHLYAGERRRGIRLIAIDVALIALLIGGVLFFQTEILKVWASLSSLSLLMAGNLVLLAFRGWVSYDAYHLAADGPAASLAPALAIAAGIVVWAVVLIPHVALGYYNLVQYSLIDEVFEETPDPVVAVESPVEETSDDGETTSATTTGLPEPVLWDGLERLNILLLGSDVGTGRRDVRTDTMIVVSTDPETGDTAMVSLPRNFSGIELPEGYGVWDCDCFPRLLNDLYFEAEQNPDSFPGAGEPGPRAIKATIGHLLDLEIQYYALVTLDGFIGIVDALGGVDINVPNEIVDETYPHEDGETIEHVVIEEGDQHLDGHLALAYARIRRHADDFARMNRQRCVLGAVMAQSTPLELLSSYGAIAEVLKSTLETDIPQERLVDLIDLLPKVSFDRVGVLHVDRDYISETTEGRTYYDQDRIRAETKVLLADPTAAFDGLSLENTCD